jgi:DNA-directed RNA polymerase subunit H (RpoH/RPB5)
MDIPEKVQQKRDLWLNSIPNLEKFMMRRNLIFQQMVNDGLFVFQHQDSGIITLLVFIFSEKMGIDSLKYIIGFCEKINIKNVIIIHQNIVTSNCRKVIESLFQYNIEIFELNQFQYDITSLYYYVPHEKVNDENLITFIKQRYQNKIPILLKTDVISRYFNFKRGDIIQINRGENNICYRIVK